MKYRIYDKGNNVIQQRKDDFFYLMVLDEQIFIQVKKKFKNKK